MRMPRTGLARAWWASLATVMLMAAGPAAARRQQQTPPVPPPAQPPPGQQPPAEQQPPTFRTGTNLVRVDVSVIDGRGEPVTSLTADDFEVRDDGLPQTITSFKLVAASGQPADEQSLEIRNPQHAAAEAAKDEVRVFLVFWDEYHISPYITATRARDGLTHALLSAFGPTDLVALMDPLTTLDALRFTRDRRQLANQAHTLQGRRGIYVPPRSAVEEEHLMNAGRIEQIRCQVTQSAVKAAAAHLGTLREGPNTLIIVSEGFGPCGERTEMGEQLRDLTRTASSSHTSIFVADPRGLDVMMRRSMFVQSLAEDTGGEALQTNDLGMIFTRAVKQASAFYLLGYSKDTPLDGKFHPIKVRVKRKGLEVRARAGYWAPLAADVERARTRSAEAEVTPEVGEALARLLPSDSPRAVDFWIGTAPAGEDRARVTAAWAPRVVSANADLAPASASMTVRSGGRVVFEGPIAQDGTSFEVQGGPLDVKLTASNAAGDIIDRDARVVTAPSGTESALTITTPAVFRARTPRQAREGQATLYAGREFDRTERITIKFKTPGASAEVGARLLNKAGTVLTTLRVQPDGEAAYVVDLPLTSIARGDFIVSIEARRGDERAEALMAFRVAR